MPLLSRYPTVYSILLYLLFYTLFGRAKYFQITENKLLLKQLIFCTPVNVKKSSIFCGIFHKLWLYY